MSDTASSTPAPPAPDAQPAPHFELGQPVVYRWVDHADGPQERWGIVVNVLEADRYEVAWLGARSGAIAAADLAEA